MNSICPLEDKPRSKCLKTYLFARTGVVLALCLTSACAAMPSEDPDASSQFIGSNAVVVPTSTGATTPSSTSNANAVTSSTGTGSGGGTTTTPTPTLSLDPVTTSTGVALRMHMDTSKCLARSSSTITQGDLLVVANCATDSRQSWAGSAAVFFADANYSIKYPIPNTTTNMTIATGMAQQAAMTIFRSLANIYGTNGGFNGYLATKDQSATVGVQIVQSSSQSASAAWDVTAVGSSVRGTILSADGCTTLCLTKSGSGVTLASCDVNNASQRWSFVSGCLNNDAGGYLTYDATQSPPTLFISASLGTCGASETWLYGRQGFWFAYTDSSSNTSVYYMIADPSTQKINVTTSPGSSHFWLFGGTKSVH